MYLQKKTEMSSNKTAVPLRQLPTSTCHGAIVNVCMRQKMASATIRQEFAGERQPCFRMQLARACMPLENLGPTTHICLQTGKHLPFTVRNTLINSETTYHAAAAAF